MKHLLYLCIPLLFFACKEASSKKESATQTQTVEKVAIDYAEGFSIEKHEGYKIVSVNSPWPKAEKPFTYLLVEDEKKVPENIVYDQKVNIPIHKIVVTSTTHIPSLESLHEENTLVGFPNLDYISSEKTRKLIEQENIKELGENEAINTEILINLQPDIVVGFAVESNNKTFSTISKSGIPVMYNGDWTESKPLGKAEWIKFFGALYNKEKEADSIFNKIKTEYLSAKKLAKKATKKPKVLAGAMYKDVWYLPYGNSWQAQFIKDAQAQYIYENTEGNGSISLAFESVLEKAQHADFWIAPGGFTTYKGMTEASEHYKKFKAFQQKKIYSVAAVTGATGGVLYYELAPNRPDLVLKDMIKIFHPDLLPDYTPIFFQPLN